MLRNLRVFRIAAVLVVSVLFPTAASASCETPLECYENAISLLKQRSDELDQLAARVAAAEAEIEDLRSQNMDLTRALESSESRLSSGIRSLDNKFERKVNAFRYTFVKPSESCPPGWTPLGVIGWIVKNEDHSRAHFGGDYGPYNPGWSWTHPYLCRRS